MAASDKALTQSLNLIYYCITSDVTEGVHWCIGCDRTTLEIETALFKEYKIDIIEIVQTKYSFCFTTF